MHKNQHNLSNRMDSQKHQIAIELRLLGFTYAQIAANPQIGLKENTIRTWFMRGGLCRRHYKRLQKQRQQEYKQIFDKMHLQLKEMAIDAVRTLGQAVKKGNVQASIKVLDLVDIQRYMHYQAHEEDEGIKLLRQIIQESRDEAKKKREENTTLSN